jgi:transcriptional regulator with XRE-family HTH domain
MRSESPLRWIRRRVFGVTQAELADIGEVSRTRVSRYETGVDDPPFGFMRRLRDEARRRGAAFSADWFFEAPAETGDDAARIPGDAEARS